MGSAGFGGRFLICCVIIRPMNDLNVLPRRVTAALETRLLVMPAVVVSGARQTGKSTLVRHLLTDQRQYFSLDDLDLADQPARHRSIELAGCRQ